MIKASWNKWNEKRIDDIFKFIITGMKRSFIEKDDDQFLLCVGTRGTGKSSLMLHAYEMFDYEGCDVKYISFTKDGFAESIKYAKEKKDLRFVGNDEANVSKRDSLTKFNKDMIDLYFAIRGLKMFHWWNNPSADIIDKQFIQEIVKGLILIRSKEKNTPRPYYYFTKTALIKIWNQYGNLKLDTLYKHRKRYAHYVGWFREYKGKLWREYMVKKQGRMEDKVDTFFSKYANGMRNEFPHTTKKMKELLSISESTFYKYFDIAVNNGEIKDGVDYHLSPSNIKHYNDKAVEKVKAELEKVHGKSS